MDPYQGRGDTSPRTAPQRLRLFPRQIPTELLAETQPSTSTRQLDDNLNSVRSTSSKKQVFRDVDSDASKLYSKYLEPRPAKWTTGRRAATFFLFSKRKRLVRFPEEVVQKAESDQRFGETMGKFREVKRSAKHREKLSALLTGSPSTDAIEASYKPDLKLYQVKPEDLPYPPSSPVQYSDKFKVTEQKFCRCLDIIEDFVTGNSQTIDYTLGVIGYLDPPGQPEPSTSTNQESRFNHIAAGIWFFVFSLQDLFQNEAPTKSEFDELLVDFSNMAAFLDRVAHRTVIFAQLHFSFGKSALALLQSATDRLQVEPSRMSRFQISKPLKLGQGLQRQSPADPSCNYVVMTRPRLTSTLRSNPWKPFASQRKPFKIEYLKEFLAKLQHRLSTLNSQMRFLTDDIFEEGGGSFRSRRLKRLRNKRKKNTFLAALQSLDVVMYRFAVFEETTPAYEQALMETVESVAMDTFQLIAKGERIIQAIIEIRDTTEMCIDYMEQVYGIDVEDLIPSDVEFNTTMNSSHKCRRRCRKRCRICYSDPDEPTPGVGGEDFWSTNFPQYLQKQAMSHSQTGYEFALKKAKAGEERKAQVLRCKPSGPAMVPKVDNTFASSALSLNPVLGPGGVWDVLSQPDITKQEIGGSSVQLDVASEIQRREDFKLEVNNL